MGELTYFLNRSKYLIGLDLVIFDYAIEAGRLKSLSVA
jgi:hypothetical protein